MPKLVWRLDVECLDPNIIGNKEKEKEFVKKFDEFYNLMVKSFKRTRTYQIGLIKINRKAFVEGEKDGFEV